MSNFNYCPIVWHFCSKSSSDKLEKLHYRALKFVYNEFDQSFEYLLQKAGKSTLHLSRLRLIAFETFKIIHGNSPRYLQKYVTL